MSGQENVTATDNAIAWFFLSLVILGLSILIWYYQQDNIRNAIRYVRFLELWILHWFVDAKQILVINKREYTFGEIYQVILEIPKTKLNSELMLIFRSATMHYYRWIFPPILFLMGLWALFKGPRTGYRSKMDVNALITRQARNFPIISPFVKFNPNEQPPRPPGSPVPAELPLFAEALSPEEWIAYHNIPMPDGKMDLPALERAFSKQLGARWRGWQKLAPHRQILLAAFCLKASRKRNDSDDMMSRIAKCWDEKNRLNFSKDRKLLSDARAVLRNPKLSDKVLKTCNQHGFEQTAMLRALMTARQDGGVLASSQFLWLRGYDRVLWYPLNNLGRQSFHMEAFGSMAHFKLEKIIGRPIPTPKIQDAITALVEYMESNRARPIPQLDYTGSKQRAIKKPKQGIKQPIKAAQKTIKPKNQAI